MASGPQRSHSSAAKGVSGSSDFVVHHQVALLSWTSGREGDLRFVWIGVEETAGQMLVDWTEVMEDGLAQQTLEMAYPLTTDLSSKKSTTFLSNSFTRPTKSQLRHCDQRHRCRNVLRDTSSYQIMCIKEFLTPFIHPLLTCG